MDLKNAMPLVDAYEKVCGQRPHVQTIRRWCKTGVLGVRLNTTYINGQYFTTEADVREFLKASTEARTCKAIKSPEVNAEWSLDNA